MKKIRVLTNLSPQFIPILPEYLQNRLEIHTTSSISNMNGLDSLNLDIEVIWVGISENIENELLDRFPNLKVIATSSTGITHIDERIFDERQLKLISLRDERVFLNSITATAELAWGLFLTCHRKIVLADRNRHYTGEFRGAYFSNQIHGSTIGIIGLGRVGTQIAKFASAFGANVKFNDIVPVEHVETLVEVTLEELCKTSDAIFVCASVGFAGNAPILGEEQINLLKPGAILVNVGRGSLVDEQKVVSFLNQGKISGYATDVIQLDETTSQSAINISQISNSIESGNNLIVTPHIGGACVDSLNSVNSIILQKILAQFDSKVTS